MDVGHGWETEMKKRRGKGKKRDPEKSILWPSSKYLICLVKGFFTNSLFYLYTTPKHRLTESQYFHMMDEVSRHQENLVICLRLSLDYNLHLLSPTVFLFSLRHFIHVHYLTLNYSFSYFLLLMSIKRKLESGQWSSIGLEIKQYISN